MTTKKFLIMRHGPSIEAGRFRVCSPFGRVKLARNALRFLGPDTVNLIAAPEWNTLYTARCIAKELGSGKPVAEQSLSDEHEGPVTDDFVRARLADPNPDVIVTHYKRLDPMLAAIERVTGAKLEIDKARMRHLNRAYLVDLEKGHVLVIKEKS